MRFVLCVVIAVIHGIASVGAAMPRELIRDLMRPSALGNDAAAPLGTEPTGMYERKTQAPIVWLDLHKSRFPHHPKTWYEASYERDAKENLRRPALDVLK